MPEYHLTDDENDEPLALSDTALSALHEFYADREEKQKQFEAFKAEVAEGQMLQMETFQEDWGESQFWYCDETATIYAEELLRGATQDTSIAVVSTPSVFIQVKNLLTKQNLPPHLRPKVYLLEFDKRFKVFPEFVFYDYRDPLNLPWQKASLKGSVSRVIADPPFLSEDCHTKAALTVRWLSKSWTEPRTSKEDFQVIISTGERMKDLINKLYRPTGVQTTDFEPVHTNELRNEYWCYANFECDNWKRKDR